MIDSVRSLTTGSWYVSVLVDVAAAQEAEKLKAEGNEALQKNELKKAVDLYTASLKKHPTGRGLKRIRT